MVPAYAVWPVFAMVTVWPTVEPGVVVDAAAVSVIARAGTRTVTVAVHEPAGLPPGQTLPAVGETTVPVRERLPGSGSFTATV